MTTNIEKLKPEHKIQIISLIEAEINRLGTQSAVANKCGVSDAVIDQLRKNKYAAKGDDMWLKVGGILGFKPLVWNVVSDTVDTKIVLKMMSDAKSKSMFMALVDHAGAGKSEGIELFMKRNPNNVFYIQCMEWTYTEFLTKLLTSLGVEIPKGIGRPVNMYLEALIKFFSKRTGRPLLIIDQANSLKPNVLSFIIHLFNECEDKLALVIAGTPHLEQMIKQGVKKNWKFYDEIDSRLGRRYVNLIGATLGDVRKICAANGITDGNKQNEIFKECEPKDKWMDEEKTQKIRVVVDKRRLKRVIQREQLLMEDETE